MNLKISENGIIHLGKSSYELLLELYSFVYFAGHVSMALFRCRKIRWQQMVNTLNSCGAEGVGITVLICLLTGVILAYQSSIQLHRFGADSLLPVLIGCAGTGTVNGGNRGNRTLRFIFCRRNRHHENSRRIECAENHGNRSGSISGVTQNLYHGYCLAGIDRYRQLDRYSGGIVCR